MKEIYPSHKYLVLPRSSIVKILFGWVDCGRFVDDDEDSKIFKSGLALGALGLAHRLVDGMEQGVRGLEAALGVDHDKIKVCALFQPKVEAADGRQVLGILFGLSCRTQDY